MYDFLVESKPHEKIDLLITASMNIYQTKKKYSNSNENRCFSEEKLIKQFGPPPFQREPPLSTNSPISEPNFKTKKPP